METPLLQSNHMPHRIFALVAASAFLLGATVGVLSSVTSSSWYISSQTQTLSPVVARLSNSRPEVASTIRTQDLGPLATLGSADKDEVLEIQPPAASLQQSAMLGLGALLAAGGLVLRALWSGPQPKQTTHADLQSVWTVASSSAEGNLGAGKKVRVATRKSPLAMWQAEFIQSELERLWPGVEVELQPMSTRGDKILDSPLAKVGGKGLFVKELENALLEGKSDIAVHSTKDVPMELPEGLVLGIICKRHDPCDAIVFPKGSTLKSLDDLPQGARVGTSSLRRQCQLLLKRPDLKFLELRGNVNTRLAKLDSGDYDAIILAAAGLKRLGFSDRVLPGETNIIDPNVMLPAAGQGALSIELRLDDPEMMALLQPLHHIPDAVTVVCERAMNRRLSGGCQVPISGFAQLKDGNLRMEARVGSVSGSGPLIIKHKTIPFTLDKPWPELQKEAEALGVDVADMLLEGGAQAYLDEAYAKQDVGVGLSASQQPAAV